MSSRNTRALWKREQEREDTRVQHLIDDRAFESYQIERRSERRHLMRHFQIERREVEMANKLTRCEEGRLFRAQQKEHDGNLIEQVQRLNAEKLMDETKRMQVHASSEDLMHLRNYLNTAYIQKELVCQIDQQKLTAMKQKNKEVRDYEARVAEWHREDEQDKIIKCEELRRKKQYLNELKDQMIGDVKRRQLRFQEFLDEKHVIDGVVRAMHEEDHKKEVERMEKVERTKREIEDFKKAQAIWKKKQQDVIDAENKSIMAHWKKQDDMGDKLRQENKLRLENHDKVVEIVGQQMIESERKKQARADNRYRVFREEVLAAQEHRYQTDLEKMLRKPIEMRENLDKQAAENKARREREAAEDATYYQQLVNKLAEDARIEQFTREKQRAKMIQFRQEANKVIEAKRAKRAEELQCELQFAKMTLDEEKSRCQMIEDERLRLLKEHAQNLLGYIPFKVLRESDLPILGPEYVEMYSSKLGQYRKGDLSKEK